MSQSLTITNGAFVGPGTQLASPIVIANLASFNFDVIKKVLTTVDIYGNVREFDIHLIDTWDVSIQTNGTQRTYTFTLSFLD